MKALSGENVNAIVVGGIGAGALSGLNRLGITVYRRKGKLLRKISCSLRRVNSPYLRPNSVAADTQKDARIIEHL